MEQKIHEVTRGAAAAMAVLAVACGAPSRVARSWQVRSGPVISNELIVGRSIDGPTAWILTAGNALVKVELDGSAHDRIPVKPLRDDEHLWGLASDGEGTFWTLASRTVLAQISRAGEIERRIDLAAPHVGVFGAGRDLVYQVMNFQPPTDALAAGPPGEQPRRVWSRMRTRALPLARPAVAALNLVSCGATAGGAVPCWFPDQPSITLTDPDGPSRELTLEGLPVVAPEILLASDNPQRPIRDALVSAERDIWVLGSGSPPASEKRNRPGGWLVARYTNAGRLTTRVRLPEPARLLLSASADRCTVLSWDGRVVEVRP